MPFMMTLQSVKSTNISPIELSVQQIRSYSLKRKYKVALDALRETLVKL